MNINKLESFLRENVNPLTRVVTPATSNDVLSNEKLSSITSIASDILSAFYSEDWSEISILARSFDLFSSVSFYSFPEKHFHVKDYFFAQAISLMMGAIGIPKKRDLLSLMENQLETYSNMVFDGDIDYETRLLISRLFILKFMYHSKKVKNSDSLFADYTSSFDNIPKSLSESKPELYYFLASIKEDGQVFFTSINMLKRFNQPDPVIDPSEINALSENINSEDSSKDIYLIVNDNASTRYEHIKQLLEATDNSFCAVISDRKNPDIKKGFVQHCLPANLHEVARRTVRTDPCLIMIDINAYGMGTGATNLLSQVSDAGHKVVIYLEPIISKFNLSSWIEEHFKEKREYNKLMVTDLRKPQSDLSPPPPTIACSV
jgi:hypothetical protein